MSIDTGEITLTFRVTVPLSRSDALNLRDRIITALWPLRIRVSSIDMGTVVRLMLSESALREARREAAPPPHSIEGGEALLCEVNPDHRTAGVPAVTQVSTAASPATPACRDCAPLSARMLS